MTRCRAKSLPKWAARWLRVALTALGVVAATFSVAPLDAAEDRAAWLVEARWGVMTHFLADWLARDNNLAMDVDQWNRLVDGFEAEGLANQMQAASADFLIFTIGQNSGYYAAPNAAYDELVGRQPSRCSRRDLIADLSRELKARGMRLIVYLPAGAPGGDRTAREALQWRQGADRNREFQLRWERVIREWSLRWGDGVDGWWFDGCYWPNAMYRHEQPPNFESFAAAARAGNPNSVVAFNPGVVDRVISITPFEDYAAGEVNDVASTLLRRVEDGRVDGTRVHRLSYLGRTWGAGPPRYDDLGEVVIPWTRKIVGAKGAMTWDVPVGADGRIVAEFLRQLMAIGRAL